MPVDSGSIYDQLLALKIDLDFEDIPTPAYLQEKILECSDAMRTIEKRIIEVTRDMSSRERNYKLEQMRLDVKRRGLLVNDAAIKKLPTGKEREAAADEVLQKDHEALITLENDVMELQNLLSSIRLVHQNLKTTNSDIRVLMRIMEQQVFKLNIGSRDDKEVKDLVAGLGEIERLEDELTPDDVESSSESIDTDKPDSRSEGTPPTTAGTVPNEAGSESGDELDTLSSFLSEDPEEIGGQTTASEEEADNEGDGSAQSAVDSGGAKNENSAPASTEATENGGGGSLVTGLDIDLGDILGDTPKASAAPAKPPEKTPVVKKESKVVAAKPAVGPPSTGAPKKAQEVELNIDDILSSLDG